MSWVSRLAALAVPALVAAGQAAEFPPREEPVLVAAARGAVLQLLTPEVQETGAVACLRVERDGEATSAGPGFLEHFQKLPFVRDGEACESRPDGVFEEATGATAYLITVGPITWVAPDEGHVRVVFRRSGSHSRQRLYRVVRDPTGWVSLGQILEMSPA